MKTATVSEARAPARTCIACGERADASELVRLVFDAGPPGIVAFDLAGGSFGRGAHVHPRPSCLAKAPRGLARAFRREVRATASDVGQALVAACDRRIAGLLLAARRLGPGALSVGTDASLEALRRGAPLAVVAVDAGGVACAREVTAAVSGSGATPGQFAIAWSTKKALGDLLGAADVAICAVRHDGIAEEIRRVRSYADAGAAVVSVRAIEGGAATGRSEENVTNETRGARETEGGECSRCPEAR